MLFKNKQCKRCGNYYDQTFEECPLCHEKDDEFSNRKVAKNVAWMSIKQELLLIFVGFAYGGLLFFQLLFSAALSGMPAEQEDLQFFLLITLSYIAVLISLVLVLSPRFKQFIKHFKGLDKYLYGIGYAVTLFVVSQIVGYITTYGFGSTINENQSNVETFIFVNPAMSILILGIVGPICEELTYRVGMYSLLRRLNLIGAIILSSVLFGLIHFDFGAADIRNELLNLPSYVVAGIILGIAYEHKGPACSITAHALYNTTSLLLILLDK